jgi:hypothetical protein
LQPSLGSFRSTLGEFLFSLCSFSDPVHDFFALKVELLHVRIRIALLELLNLFPLELLLQLPLFPKDSGCLLHLLDALSLELLRG